MVWWLIFGTFTTAAQVQSLVWELRTHAIAPPPTKQNEHTGKKPVCLDYNQLVSKLFTLKTLQIGVPVVAQW